MYLRGVAIFCLALVPSILSHDNIHKYMSKRQIRQVFQTDADSVPEHEIFEIEFPELSHRTKRHLLPPGTRLKIRLSNLDISLWLHPPEAPVIHTDTPVWFADFDWNEKENVRFHQETGWLDGIGHLMEDPNHLASMWIHYDIDRIRAINGRIEKRGIVIKPLPSHVVGEYLRSKRSIADFDPSNSTYHVAYRIKDDPANDDFVATTNQTALRERLVRSTGRIPETLYMETLLVVDNTMKETCDYYELRSAEYKYCIELVLAYLAIFWNGVDLRYRLLDNPQLRISISAIVLANRREVLSYISKYRLPNAPENIDGDNALFAARSFFFNIQDTFPLHTWDIAVTMTRTGIGEGATTVGNAYRWGACGVRSDQVEGVLLLCDDGSFNSITFAVHELGHTLGLHHDYDATGCDGNQGFIMAPWVHFTNESSFFSPCSVAVIQANIDAQNLTCLYNEPPVGNEIRSIRLAGEVRSLDQQCRTVEKEAACKIEGANICDRITCYNGYECVTVNRPALDGTQCGDENDTIPKICVQNKCLPIYQPPVDTRLYECIENGRIRPDGTRCGDENDALLQICVRGECVPEDPYQMRNARGTCLRYGDPVRDGTPCQIPKHNILGVCRKGRCLQRN